MCNTYKQLNSVSCVTHGTDKNVSVCNTYAGLSFFHVLHIYRATLIHEICLGLISLMIDVPLLC